MSSHWDIIHIDLSEGAKRLAAAPGGVLVVLWWREIPLGQLKIEAARLPMSAEQMAELALEAIAPALDAYVAGPEMGLRGRIHSAPRSTEAQADPARLLRAAVSLFEHLPTARQAAAKALSVSLVVPTCNRPRRLAACLGSLGELSHAPLEILVVDNAPSSATREVVESFPTVRYIAEPRRGSSAARNTGVEHSRGQLVAFVDDDETVHPDWLSWLVASFRDPSVALVTGLVLPSELTTEAQQIFEQRYGFGRGYVARTFDRALYRRTRHFGVPVWEIGGSGNMAIRRDVFLALGGFDERLGAGRAGGCEELELFYRVLAADLSCHYEPRAVTEHQHRRDL
ncbi:MAG: glycosyltransferase family A protein, partial [Acidobacteriota bacterium]